MTPPSRETHRSIDKLRARPLDGWQTRGVDMHAAPHWSRQLRQMEVPGQPMLLEPLAQIAERASQGALQLLQLANLAPGGLRALGRRLTEGAQLGRAVVKETPRTNTRQIGQRRC